VAHSKSAEKRVRQNEKARLRNRRAKAALRTTIKKYKKVLGSGDAAAAGVAFREVQKKLDKTVQKGILRKKTASRLKSRLSRKVVAKPAAT